MKALLLAASIMLVPASTVARNCLVESGLVSHEGYLATADIWVGIWEVTNGCQAWQLTPIGDRQVEVIYAQGAFDVFPTWVG